MTVAGSQYPRSLVWPSNVEGIEHVRLAALRFYGMQRFTLNLTRADMIEAGYSPSVRLFEAAACACPIISDWWERPALTDQVVVVPISRMKRPSRTQIRLQA